ncbi:uncharacterized protein [Halyomorpha halys]|uniref:uncharacterized protein isoform X6 n=1 Tax=Halyomorpha halys TaxID=286706 RepID=UPI0006D50798|nr:uncharacterized protein LOC106681395 isoform X5 [Halyomorpha halys]
MVDTLTENIIMTPKAKSANSTTIVIERKAISNGKPNGNNVHVAGGDHKGIVINKVATVNDTEEAGVPEISLQFLVFLVNGQTGLHTQESRKLFFWFKPNVPIHERPTVAQEFFKELVSPLKFPRDYVGFIKVIMKLMQNVYPTIRKIEVELRQLGMPRELPVRPLSTDDSILSKEVPLTEKKILELIEAAYPHPVTIEDLAKDHGWDEALVQKHVESLKEKGLVKAMEHGAFTRIIQHEKDIQIVKQMPTIIRSKQPTIAIITAQYCEKLAVDSMLENKETFVRYTTVGESNVYTLGNIGHHRVVCTKLPTLGYTREAITSAGNTTTRLLGTFQMVDNVFIVGVGGGVPHYTDYSRHVRLGDVVVSASDSPGGFAYTYCEKASIEKDGSYNFEIKKYNPINDIIQEVARKIKEQDEKNGDSSWLHFMEEGLSHLGVQSEHDFIRPSGDTDKLYMPIGEKDLIEVAHPQPQDATDSWTEERPRLHVGPVGSGRDVSRDTKLREEFCRKAGLLALDFESDCVVESIVGNRTLSWALVRGAADYKDGIRRSPWQAYASLTAAAVVRSIIANMPTAQEDD